MRWRLTLVALAITFPPVARSVRSKKQRQPKRFTPTEGSKALRRKMRERKLNQAQVRKLVGCQAGMVTRWLSGERKPGPENMFALERALGIKAELWLVELVGGADEDEDEPAIARTGTGG